MFRRAEGSTEGYGPSVAASTRGDDDPSRFFTAWQTSALAGGRLVTDGLVRPECGGGDAALRTFLGGWPGAWYWGDDAGTRLVLIRGTAEARPERWLWHGALLVLYAVCTLGAGAIVVGALSPPLRGGLVGSIDATIEFARLVFSDRASILLTGWAFAAPLFAIVLIHELGHYFAARRYAIDVSPPYFLPVPPNLSPIGGLGAFIRLRSAVYDRRQLLDVGASGPLAGFVVAVVVLLIGYPLSHRVSSLGSDASSFVLFAGHPIFLGDSVLTHVLRRWLVPGYGAVLLSPQAFAGWVGMFVTGLNLLPLSQLDGGHVAYGLFGRGQRAVALVAGLGLLVLGTRAPMWYIWAGLTFVIGGGGWGHPPVVMPTRRVQRAGRWTGWACIIVFVLTFAPVPFG